MAGPGCCGDGMDVLMRAARVLAEYHGSPDGAVPRAPEEHTLRQARMLARAGLLAQPCSPCRGFPMPPPPG